jgi:hypothetical protein
MFWRDEPSEEWMNTYLSIDSGQVLFRKLAKPMCHYFIQNATRFAIWFLPFAWSNIIGPFNLLPELHLHCGQNFTAKYYISLLPLELCSASMLVRGRSFLEFLFVHQMTRDVPLQVQYKAISS